MRQKKRSRDLSVECGYYDELYMDVLDVTVLRSDKYMWIKARYNQNTSIG